MATRADVANELFPEIDETIESLRQKFPQRSVPVVTRFGPSPTGFLHLGGVYSAFVGRKFAKQNWGKIFLRIEDTDQARQVEGGLAQIVEGLQKSGIEFDEGPIGENFETVGDFGPYVQSERKKFYEIFAKEFVARGLAYPCRMKTEEIDEIRAQQEKQKILPGIYGNFSVWRHKNPDEILAQIRAEKPLVLRFRAHGDTRKKVVFEDFLRGKIEMQDNFNDLVLIKGDGLPTYHFAHLVDDFLMGTTQVIRGEEWLTSLPLHLQLFAAVGLEPPVYCHLAPILKLDEGKKRKLSKRKDPEANIDFFWEQGFPAEGVLNYLMNIADSRFEDWQRENPEKDFRDFAFVLEKMNSAGALFDEKKLRFLSNFFLSKMSNEELFARFQRWVAEYQPVAAELVRENPELALAALSIERFSEKDPRRYSTLADVLENILPFFDGEWARRRAEKPAWPESVTADIFAEFLQKFEEKLDAEFLGAASRDAWFENFKKLAAELGFAGHRKEFVEGEHRGVVGDLAMVLRIELFGSKRSPDLRESMRVLGRDRVVARLRAWQGK